MADNDSFEDIGRNVRSHKETLDDLNALRVQASEWSFDFLEAYRLLGRAAGHSMGQVPPELPNYPAQEDARKLLNQIETTTQKLNNLAAKLKHHGITPDSPQEPPKQTRVHSH